MGNIIHRITEQIQQHHFILITLQLLVIANLLHSNAHVSQLPMNTESISIFHRHETRLIERELSKDYHSGSG